MNGEGVKLWKVMREMNRADRRHLVMVDVTKGSRVVIGFL